MFSHMHVITASPPPPANPAFFHSHYRIEESHGDVFENMSNLKQEARLKDPPLIVLAHAGLGDSSVGGRASMSYITDLYL